MKGESGAVDRGIGGGPSRNDDADDSGKPGDVGRHRAGDGVGVLGEFDLRGQHEGRGDPGHVVSNIHSGGGSPTAGVVFCIAEDREIGHANMHRGIAEPGKEHDGPKAHRGFVFATLREGDGVIPNGSEFGPTGDLELIQGNDSAGQKDEDHPGCCDIGKSCDGIVSA